MTLLEISRGHDDTFKDTFKDTVENTFKVLLKIVFKNENTYKIVIMGPRYF